MWHRLYARALWPICVKQIGLGRGTRARTSQKLLFLSESWRTKAGLSNGKRRPTQQHAHRSSKSGLFGEPLLGWHAVDGKQGVHGKGREIGKRIIHGGVCESGDIGNYSEGISGNRVSVWSATTSFRGLLVWEEYLWPDIVDVPSTLKILLAHLTPPTEAEQPKHINGTLTAKDRLVLGM